MTSYDKIRGRLWRRLYALLTAAIHPFLYIHLKNRLAQGKEDPSRWREKMAVPNKVRSEGKLVWLHAVGLGETLALRGVIIALKERLPTAQILVTTGTRTSADVFAANAPLGIIHQYLPMDTPKNVSAFLDYWRPSLSIWTEQELWPGFVFEAARRCIPLALINARLTQEGFTRRRRVTALYHTLFNKFAFIAAQNLETATRLQKLGASNVQVVDSVKSIAPMLSYDLDHLRALQATILGKFIWIAASTHEKDEEIVLEAHARLLQFNPSALLVIIPRSPERAQEIVNSGQIAGLNISLDLTDDKQVWVIDRFGQLGLWYRLAKIAFIGGTNCAVEGHNPWEAAILSCPILSGPRYENFSTDFSLLHRAGAAEIVHGAEQLTQVLLGDADWKQIGKAAQHCAEEQKHSLAQFFDMLAELCP